MSVKIHNGYRLTGPARDPFDLTAALTTTLRPTYRALYSATLARLACLTLDTWNHITPPDAPSGPVATAWIEMHDAQHEIQKTRRRNPAMDFQCDLAVLRDPADLDGPRYGLLYTERPEYTKAFNAIPGVEAWPYWNNTDPPGETTTSEWETRRDTWARVLPGCTAPATIGLTWNLLGDYDGLDPIEIRNDVAAAIPPVEQRARALAATQVDVMVPGQRPLLRSFEDIAADRAELAVQYLPVLRDITIDDLYSPWTPKETA